MNIFNNNKNEISKPEFNISGGTYNKTQILSITNKSNFEMFYAINNTEFRKYWGPFAVKQDASIKAYCIADNKQSEQVVCDIKIQKSNNIQKGKAVIIGGAEHCKEIHQKLIDLAGGIDKAKIVFIPSSSSDAYASGIDRVTRFTELCGFKIDKDAIPTVNGKKDYSSIEDKSRFWILPVAVKDDENTNSNPEDDDRTLLADESQFPNIDESKWINNGFSVEVAEKLRDEDYNIIFFTGGNQARYMKCFTYPDGTEGPVLSIIREIYEEKGGVISGTSAGGAVLSDIMMQGGGSYGAIMQGIIHKDTDVEKYVDNWHPYESKNDGRLWIGKGFGILHPVFLSDTHFVARGRIGRLISGCLYLKEYKNRNIIGIGSDEDTGVVIYPDGKAEVVGALGSVIVDVSKANIQEGEVKTGKYVAKNIIVHYLEAGDTFSFNVETGELKIQGFNSNKTLNTIPASKEGDNTFIEHDIFGRDKFKNAIYQYLANNSVTELLTTALEDNMEDSYDEILSRDLEKSGTLLMKISKTEQTQLFEGEISYKWWGESDKDYPELSEVREEERYSISYLKVDICPLIVANNIDLSDAPDMPLKSNYIHDGNTESDWLDLFDESKKFYFGMLLNHEDSSILIQTFFYDYAYYDTDNNRQYTPPRMRPVDVEDSYEDYDISEMSKAENAKIYVDDELIGVTDCYGRLKLTELPEGEIVSAVYEGRIEYVVELKTKHIEKNKACIVFSDSSY